MSRPRSIAIIGWTFIAVGGVAIVASLSLLVGVSHRSLDGQSLQRPEELGLQLVIRGLAVLCGAFLLYGRNWARWLIVAWLGYHVVLGALHSPFGFAVHVVLFALVAYFLFRLAASAYFRGTATNKLREVTHE